MFFLQVLSGSPSSSGPILSIYGKHPQSFFWGFSLASLLALYVENEQKISSFLFLKRSFHGWRNPNAAVAMLAIMSMATPWHANGYVYCYASGYTLDYAQVATLATTPMAMPAAICTTMPTTTLHDYAYDNVTGPHPQTIFMVACTRQKVTVSSSFYALARSSLPSIFVYKT